MKTLRHPIAMFVMAVLIVIGTGVGGLAATGNAALVSANVAPSVLATIAGEQAFAFSVAPPATVPRVTLSKAIRTGAMDPATVVAAQLLEIRAPVTKGKARLVWAIQESATLGSFGPRRVQYDFQVDFVNADSSVVVFSADGYAPRGTPLG
jgi:hypothetical protein